MFRKRNVSVYSDFKTGFFCKLSLFLGIVLLIFYIIQTLTHIIALNGNIMGTIFAFSILFLGLGFILYFISYQFAKLAKIAKEIENGDEIENIEETKE